ncbi:MAG: hypothetical protein ACC628_19880 [Pirellulaceae bacterium]
MTCVHLQRLYQLCEENSVKLSSSDLIHIVCLKCGRQEVCPSTLSDEYEARKADQDVGTSQTANNA